ncbi:hypothetical protein MON38_10500 [Hymenobacter sp. DH14]|uniref:MoxR-vWA-beta-propeller ternary system domain-containing protein n=1 Tax=Hymenobacter cyanobacteriorum TaxID=2926463 RepID=A0A9X1VIZ0_9BACT|nr:hypothetical protein [Hymenobacter cyanobacteriorum]MCI1187850.1 hypothetical protein [Hymenobacter cyanobacteriorum]
MLLTLRYHETAQRPASAAFLRGADPAAWLRELSRWNLPAAQLTCYLVPESIRSVQVAGLFVVAAGDLPADVLEPYGREADGRLYVPVGATLWPATAPGELAGALLWPRQLLHPGIGLVGFDTADELDLATLLDCPASRPTDWSRARPGLAPRPRLQQVRVLQPTVEEVVQSIQEEVGTVPLAQLPGLADDQTGPLQTAFDNLRHWLLRVGAGLWRIRPRPLLIDWGFFGKVLGGAALVLGVLALMALLFSALGSHSVAGLIMLVVMLGRLFMRLLNERSPAPTAPRRPAPAAPARPGFGQRVEQWLNRRIHNLEQKRQNEIERLLKLFGESLEEALKYAIPLGGPYQDRGRAPESARLGQRNTEFNLGRLGGGGRVDAWNLDSYRHSLSLRYRAAATQEINAGRFKKAAYIYAHLLGDYPAAANTLEQGGFCREAAALYKDHLHNKPAAAKCLENGGLLLEAAELYAELKEHEKAGDLHQRLAQPALAARHYERGVALLLDNHDHPAAARLLAHKLVDTGRAQEVLLQGWASPKQPEVCLRQYFDLLAAAPGADLSAPVRTIFAEHTPRERRVPLLRVLATLSEKHPAPTLLSTARDIAYEVVSTEAAAGNLAHLSLLRHFVPDDRLLAADCGRFISQPRARPATGPTAGLTTSPLDPTIHWKAALTHRHQWVAVGVRDERLHLARGNWYGQVEYYSWITPVPAGTEIVLVADEQHGPRIILRPSEQLSLETKYLPQNKYFAEALTVECPSWLPPWPARVCLLPDGGTATARLQNGNIVVERYLAEGKRRVPFAHPFAEGNPDEYANGRNWPAELLYRDGMYYSYWQHWLVCWAEDGRGRTHQLPDGEILQLVPSPYTPKLQLAIAMQEDLFNWEPTQPISNEPLPAFLSTYSLAGNLQFVGPEHLVVLDDSCVALLRWEEKGYDEVRLIELKSTPVAVLATRDRQQFAVLEESGHISLHQISDD